VPIALLYLLLLKMLSSYTVFIFQLKFNRQHFEDPRLLGCVTVTGLVFLKILNGYSVFIFRGPKRIVFLNPSPPQTLNLKALYSFHMSDNTNTVTLSHPRILECSLKTSVGI
jgi:hypothetical protein